MRERAAKPLIREDIGKPGEVYCGMLEVSVSSDPYKGLFAQYKSESDSVVPKEIRFKHPGTKAPPEKRTLDAPPIETSKSTDRKKTNPLVCYTRVTPLDSQRACGETEGCVFVSRHGTMFTGEGHIKRSLVASLDVLNAMLEKEDDAVLPAGLNPLDDWRSVAKLREWTLDGVLLSHRNEANVSDVLNVGVEGPCSVRNVFDKMQVLITDVCYIALVFDPKTIGERRFKYVPCTCRTFAEPDAFAKNLTHVKKPHELTLDLRRRLVGCWKVGKVMDSAAVKLPDQHTLTVNVKIEWIGWRALRQQYPGAEIGRPFGLGVCASDNPCLLFYWPTKVDAKTRLRWIHPRGPSSRLSNSSWERTGRGRRDGPVRVRSEHQSGSGSGSGSGSAPAPAPLRLLRLPLRLPPVQLV